MAAIWVKTGKKDLEFRVQKQLANFETPVLVRADGNVTSKIKDGSLVKSAAPKFTEEKPVEKSTVKKKDNK